MQWRDTAERYGLVTRGLHWLIAALILWQLFGMALKLLLGRHPAVAPFVIVHQPIGLAILVLVALRILWALASRNRRPAHAEGFWGRFAAWGQRLLYLLMLVVPVLGMIRAQTRSGGPGRPGGPGAGAAPPAEAAAALPPRPPAEVDPVLAAIGQLHGPLALTLLLLICGHVLMALYHAVLRRDGATDAMFGRLRG